MRPMRRTSPTPDREAANLEVSLLEDSLYGSAREFLARPSKRLRSRLIQVCYTVAGGDGPVPEAAADMIELLHSGSLVVDDIQDGADVRRGGPALHRVIGLPRALNTGNWLYFVALTRLDELDLDAERARSLTKAAHQCLLACHKGQALDLSVKVRDVDRTELPAVASLITQYKTAGPMGLAARMGATAANAPVPVVEILVAVGEQFGMALQMLDDLGSLVAPERHHKGVEDLSNERVSWVWSWASEVAEPEAFQSLASQLADGSDLSSLRDQLATLVEPLGRARARNLLRKAERDLRETCAPSAALDLVRAEFARLEHSFG